MRRFVIGDIHGNYKSLLQCFDRSGFDRDRDTLICLGDVVDGYPDVKECVDELLKVKLLIYIMGNHDAWFLDWVKMGRQERLWTSQGGNATISSYGGSPKNVPKKHIDLFNNKAVFYCVFSNKLFVHGGFDTTLKDIRDDKPQNLMWDRSLMQYANNRDLSSSPLHVEGAKYKVTTYDEVFIGHTSTTNYRTTDPINVCEVWNLDTGAGWEGRLTIMDVDTKEYWQSDFAKDLYPEGNRRGE